MGKKAQTILTYQVKISLPPGMNAAEMQGYLGDAICNYSGSFEKEHPMLILKREDFTVALKEKVTKYA